MKEKTKNAIAGAAAGLVNGVFGAGGGMILVPILTAMTDLEDAEVFPASVSTILPICFVSLTVTGLNTKLPIREALPYLLGAVIGGILVGITGNKIPVKWLHRLLGALILWGGVRYLC